MDSALGASPITESAAERRAPTFSIPGPGGSLGKCALCGDTFLKEILFGETVAMVACDNINQGRSLPMHKECAEKAKAIHNWKDFPEGPLRTFYEQHKDIVREEP